MNRQQDSHMRDPGRQAPSSPRTPGHRAPGHSSPSDTRSNAASGLTQQGLENQRPGGERHDASSEMQPGSSLEARLDRPGALGTPHSERGKPGPQAHPQPDSAALDQRAASRGQTGRPLAGESMLDEENPADPRERL